MAIVRTADLGTEHALLQFLIPNPAPRIIPYVTPPRLPRLRLGENAFLNASYPFNELLRLRIHRCLFSQAVLPVSGGRPAYRVNISIVLSLSRTSIAFESSFLFILVSEAFLLFWRGDGRSSLGQTVLPYGTKRTLISFSPW